jgi:hypothetical protein
MIAAGLLAVTALAGAAEPAVASDDSALEKRARAWWTVRQAKDAKAMYELLEPAYRNSTTFDVFLVQVPRLTRIPLEDVRFESITRVPDAPRAKVTFAAKSKLPRAGETVDIKFEDQWVFEQGEWWRVYVPPVLPFNVEPVVMPGK